MRLRVKDMNHLEGMQKAATGLVKGLRSLTYENTLEALNIQSLEKRRIRKDDPQDKTQPNCPGSNSIVNVL